MRWTLLVLAAMLLPAASGLAQDGVLQLKIVPLTEQEAEKPAPQLVQLDSSLLKAQEDKQQGRIDEKQYQEFLAKFREDLEAAVILVKPTPANTALHARILSRLGDSKHALAALGPAIEQDPASPALRVALGQVRYDQKDYPAALAEAKAALARDPENKAALALKHSSEGRIGPSGAALGGTASIMTVPDGVIVAGADFTIPQKNDISPQAMALVRQAIAARREGDMARTWSHMQAAMNADPRSTGVQKLYAIAKEDKVKYTETKDYLQRSKEALDAGRGEEAVAWAQKAADRSGDSMVREILELTKQQSARLTQTPAEREVPKRGVPLWPIGAGLGLTAIGYGVAKSKGAWAEQEAEAPAYEDPNSERIQRNRYRFKVAAVSAAIGFGIVYGGVWLAGTAGPAAVKVMRESGGSLQRVSASEAGAISPFTKGTGTVWDSIKATGPLIKGTDIPRSFDVVVNGRLLVVHPAATKHFSQHLGRFGGPVSPAASQAFLTSFRGALEKATAQGLPKFEEKVLVDGWEFILSQWPSQAHPVVIHAVYHGR